MRWNYKVVYTTTQKIFYKYYAIACFFSIFVLIHGWKEKYENPEANKAKWLGLIWGTITNAAIIVVIYFLVRL